MTQPNSEISDIEYKNVEPAPGIVFDTQQCFSIGNLVVLQIKINITSGIFIKNTAKVAKVPDEWIPSLTTGWIAGSSALVSMDLAKQGIPCFAGVDTDGYVRLASDQAVNMYGASISAMYLINQSIQSTSA